MVENLMHTKQITCSHFLHLSSFTRDFVVGLIFNLQRKKLVKKRFAENAMSGKFTGFKRKIKKFKYQIQTNHEEKQACIMYIFYMLENVYQCNLHISLSIRTVHISYIGKSLQSVRTVHILCNRKIVPVQFVPLFSIIQESVPVQPVS